MVFIVNETTELPIQTLETQLKSLAQTLKHHITEYEKIVGITSEQHPKYDVFLRAKSRLAAATAEAERDEPLLRQQIQGVTESIKDLSPEKPEKTFFAWNIRDLRILSTFSHLMPTTQTAPLLPTEITPPARPDTPHSQQSLSAEDSNIPAEPSLNQELKDAQKILTRELLLYARLISNTFLQEHYRHLTLSATNAENITIILMSPEEAVKRNLAHCYTLHAPIPGGDALSDSANMQLSYIATDGSIIRYTETFSNSIDFFRKKGIEVKENSGMRGMAVPTAVFQQYLTKNNCETLEEVNTFLTNLIQKLHEACAEVIFHKATAQLQRQIDAEPQVEYPECDLYLMPIPEGKQSNYINCYIYDDCRLVYIPPFIWNKEQKAFQENIDGQSETVNITNYHKLHDGINRLKENSPSKSQLTLNATDYLSLIYNNGKHIYYARKQHCQEFKDARHALEDITSYWSTNITECDIVYTKPPENEIKSNTLYIYKDNESQLKYTIKRSDRAHTAPSQPKASMIDTFFSYFTQPKPTPIIRLPERIEGSLNLDANSALSRQVEYAITHKWLGQEQEQALWTHIYQINTSINPTVYKPKDAKYLQKIEFLTCRLREATYKLDHYIEKQQMTIETILDKAQKELRAVINNDEVYDSLKHKHDAISRHIVTLYEEAIRLYKLIPDDHPHQPKLKRLAIAIQQRNIELTKTEPDNYSNVLSMHELPAVMRQLNVPFSSQIKQHSERQLNIPLMLLGIALLAASVALWVFSHGLSTPLSCMGINLGLHLLFNMTAAGVVSGTAVYATGLFFGPKKVVAESVDELSNNSAAYC
jgi:hypothetical protein